MQKINIWLDDERDPALFAGEGWIWTKSVEETIDLLKKHGMSNVARLSLDHDLGSGVVPGYEVLLWIEQQIAIEKMEPPARMYVHSMNPIGKAKMMQAIKKIYEIWETSPHE